MSTGLQNRYMLSQAMWRKLYRDVQSGRQPVRDRVLTYYRMLNSSRRALPHFIIVGAQKAGTTSLYAYLSQHPQAILPEKKELHFFDYKFLKGTSWYRSHFPTQQELELRQQQVGSDAITGEASPYYLFHPHAARRIAQLIPEVKLIVLLRNPVDRAYSHYHHNVRLKLETRPFEEAIESEQNCMHVETETILNNQYYRSYVHQHFSYVSRGVYANQLRTFYQYFQPSQMLILCSEDLFRDPQPVYDQALDFLHISPWRLTDAKAKNVGRYQKENGQVGNRLEDHFKPFNNQLSELTGITFGW